MQHLDSKTTGGAHNAFPKEAAPRYLLFIRRHIYSAPGDELSLLEDLKMRMRRNRPATFDLLMDFLRTGERKYFEMAIYLFQVKI